MTAIVEFRPYDDLPGADQIYVSGMPRSRDLDAWVGGRECSIYADGHSPVIRDEIEQGSAPRRRVIMSTEQWFPDDVDVRAAGRAWRWLEAQIQHAWHDNDVRLLATPGTTGRDLWLRTPAADGCPIMSRELQDHVRATSGQGRIETFPARTAMLPGLYEYDLRLAYAAVLRGLPVGEPEWIATGRAVELREPSSIRSRLLVSFQPPAGWRSVGIIGIRHDDAGWSWPVTPRMHGPTWADGCEVELAVREGWRVIVHEAVIWPNTGDPLRTWSERLLAILTGAARELEGDDYRHVRSMVRAIILHTVGAFHGAEHRITRTAATLSDAPIGAAMLRTHADGSVSWRETTSAKWPEAVHPEWSAHVWARSRVRLLRNPAGGGMLTLERGDLVAVRTDAVYTTRPVGWDQGDDGKPGRWVLKRTLTKPAPWPRTGDEVVSVREGR